MSSIPEICLSCLPVLILLALVPGWVIFVTSQAMDRSLRRQGPGASACEEGPAPVYVGLMILRRMLEPRSQLRRELRSLSLEWAAEIREHPGFRKNWDTLDLSRTGSMRGVGQVAGHASGIARLCRPWS